MADARIANQLATPTDARIKLKRLYPSLSLIREVTEQLAVYFTRP
jgi:hypothetical protein